ncbi:MAG: VIT family protein [Alphaproteobacteria bacterium]
MPALEDHYIHRVNWLRAAILGANDGLVSTSSLIIGVASSGANRHAILIAGIAGLVAGAMSMAAGEYVSVSSQVDTEHADLEREKHSLIYNHEEELDELKENFMGRGLSEETALEVARQLTEHDALSAHAREELGITDNVKAHPFQAAFSSAVSFIIGASLPLLCAIILPLSTMTYGICIATLLFLALLGAVGAKLGGANKTKAIIRVTFWGVFAMAFTALVGYIFGISVG